jgi:urease accessory protein
MQALARVAVDLAPGTDGGARNRIAVLRSEPPLVLRPILAATLDGSMRWQDRHPLPAMVTLVAGRAGPLGGDRLCLESTLARTACWC